MSMLIRGDADAVKVLRELIKWYRSKGINLDTGVSRGGSPVPYQFKRCKITTAPTTSAHGKAVWLKYKHASTDFDHPYDESSTNDTLSLANGLLDVTALTTGDEVIVWKPHDRPEWEPFPLMAGSRRCTCLLYASLSSGSTDATVDNVKPIDGGASPTTSLSETLSVANTHHWKGSNNGLGRIELNRSASRWELYQLTCSTS